MTGTTREYQNTAKTSIRDIPQGLGNILSDMIELQSRPRHKRRLVKIAKHHRFVVKRYPDNNKDVTTKKNRFKKTWRTRTMLSRKFYRNNG